MHSSSSPSKPTRYFVGSDVDRAMIAACVYDSEASRPCYETGFCARTPIKLTRFVDLVHRRFGGFRACCEASFCGCILHRDLSARGIDCAVIAPGSVPRRSGDRIKNDQLDARKLARMSPNNEVRVTKHPRGTRECFVKRFSDPLIAIISELNVAPRSVSIVCRGIRQESPIRSLPRPSDS